MPNPTTGTCTDHVLGLPLTRVLACGEPPEAVFDGSARPGACSDPNHRVLDVGCKCEEQGEEGSDGPMISEWNESQGASPYQGTNHAGHQG